MPKDPFIRKLLIVAGVLIVGMVMCFGAGVFFYPKPRTTGELDGMIGPGMSSYREDFKCLGVPYDFCPNWPDYGCDYLCYGWVYDKECSIQMFATLADGSYEMQFEPTACE